MRWSGWVQTSGGTRRLAPVMTAIAIASAAFAIAPASHAEPQAAAGVPERYLSQEIDWVKCLDSDLDPGLPADFYRLECGSFLAPRDWQEPAGSDSVRIAVSRLPAGQRPAAGVTFTNPGGPGAAGRDLPLVFALDGRTALTRSQDIYGMDPRGSGASTNLTCGAPMPTLLDPRDRSNAAVDLQLDAAQLTARLCAHAGGSLMRHVSTADTVRDLDLLRELIGVSRVNWIGYSAGTWLGAYYASTFPQHTGRFVLDSVVDFTGSWQRELELQPRGFQRRFRADFARWTAGYDAIYHLGTTAREVEAGYERVRAAIAPESPLDNVVLLDRIIAGAMYTRLAFPDVAWLLSDLSAYLDATSSGDAAVATAAEVRVAARLPRLRDLAAVSSHPRMSTDASDATYLAVTCNDTRWSGGREGLVARSWRAGTRYPLIGWSTIDQPCAFWEPPSSPLHPARGAGVPSVLLVQSERDPATPVEGARRAAERFAGARLMLVTGEGDHGLFAGGNDCVNRAVEGFIVDGVLPAAGATCRGLPFPDPTQIFLETQPVPPSPETKPFPLAKALPRHGTNPLVALRGLDALLGPLPAPLPSVLPNP